MKKYFLFCFVCFVQISFFVALLTAKEDQTFFEMMTVCFVACHAGPADHFSTFAQELTKRGYKVEIHAAGPALKKFQDRKMEWIHPFVIDNRPEMEVAIEVAKKCSKASIVITDVGHGFDISLQHCLATHAKNALRVAYYDNPEAYVPGGYSEVASSVMQAAQKVFFANSNLASLPIYKKTTEEINIPFERRIGIGYYPLEQAERVAKRRIAERKELRSEFFVKCGLIDRGQKILVYTGGNNEEYFARAFPAFLRILTQAKQNQNFSNFVILLQQHPGAKEKSLDAKMLRDWMEENQNDVAMPCVIISDLNSEDAQVIADMMLYYQTSMGPQFILAGIPTIQIGHGVYEDILIKNNLCSSVVDSKAFVSTLKQLEDCAPPPREKTVRKGLGVQSEWVDILIDAIERNNTEASFVSSHAD